MYRKTAKGVEAIAARLHGLVGKSRSMLILVDGKRSTIDLLVLAKAKLFASRRLMEILGPTSAPLCLRIEAAKNLNEFVEAVKRAYTAIRDIRGPAAAERFGSAVEANRPLV